MRHYLRRELGRPFPLPGRVLAGSLGRLLVLGPCSQHRLAPLEEAALAGAVDLAMVARGADADRPRASRAVEETMAIDHLTPRRGRFWTRIRCRAMLHRGTSRRSP